MKVALVNTQTNIVENVIMVDSLDDLVPENYKLVEIPVDLVSIPYTAEELELYDILETIDPDFVRPVVGNEIERVMYIGETKWSEERGFYEGE